MTLATTIQSAFNWLWLGWLGLFIVIEGAALLLANKFNREQPYSGGTLSELVWRLIRKGLIIFVVFALFWTWLTLHFFTAKV